MTGAIRASSLGPLAVAGRAFSLRGATFLTAIVKATFLIKQDAPLELTKPRPLVARDQLRAKTPLASVSRPSDLAPILPRAEIVLDAIAFAPGPPVARLTTRLAVARGTTLLLSKSLEIVGDRRARPGARPSEPEPFASIPVVYERAFGGPAHRENPSGTGDAPDADGVLRLPNVVGGEGARAEPAGFGAISKEWASRARRAGARDAARDDARLLALPADLDEAYFQSAPVDQQVDAWRSGDLVVMVNLHPAFPTLRATLPAARAVAMVESPQGRQEISLRPDLIHIEPHMLRAEIVYRGSIPVAPEHLDRLVVIGALDEDGQRHAWSAPSPAANAPGARPEGDTLVIGTKGNTLVMDDGTPAKGGGSTLVLDGPTDEPQARGTLVIEAATPEPTSDPRATVELELGDSPRSLPFPKAERTAAQPADARGLPPPWSDGHGAVVSPADEKASSTLVLSVEEPREKAPAPEPPAASPPREPAADPPAAPRGPARSAARKAVWRTDPDEPPPPRPTAPPPEPEADVRGTLYKRFGR